MKEFGIDVSAWQRGFNFLRAKAEGVRYVVIRAAYSAPGVNGNAGKDTAFEEHYAAAMRAGLSIGAYQYSMATTVTQAKAEAEALCSYLKGKRFDLPIYYDVEDTVQKKLGKRKLTDIVKAWLSYMESKGYYVGIYASKSFFSEYLYDGELTAYTHWVAQWDTACSYVPASILGMWQFGGETNRIRTNKVAGVTCDQNYMLIDFPSEIKKKGLNGYPKPAATTDGSKGQIAGVDKQRLADELIIYYTGSKANTNPYGWECAVDKNGVVLENPAYKGGTEIPKGGKVISGHGKAATWVKNNLKMGYLVWIENGTIKVNTKPHRTVDNENGIRTTNTLVVYNKGTTASTNPYGWEVAIKDGKALNDPIYGKGHMDIPAGGYVLSGHANGEKSGGEFIRRNIKKGTAVKYDGKVITIG